MTQDNKYYVCETLDIINLYEFGYITYNRKVLLRRIYPDTLKYSTTTVEAFKKAYRPATESEILLYV